MSDIWVISDTHFNHYNILTFHNEDGSEVRPGFSSLKEMNECMIDNWNSVVKQGDKVYHLGDVFFGPKEWFQENWPKLNGSKRLVVGNHDDIKYLSSGGFFKKVYMWRMFPEYNLLFSHVPLHPSHIRMDCTNVHGHIHGMDSPEGKYINVCVEKTNYTPVHIETLREEANGSS